MKVILLQDIAGLGKKNEVKDVADGYALNFLLPKKMAETATPQSLARVQKILAAAKAKKQLQADLLAKTLKSLVGKEITLKSKANDRGQLFAAVRAEEISQAIKEQTGVAVSPSLITLTQPLKTIGDHEVVLGRGTAEEFVLKVKVEVGNKDK
jgi:large subunit ribosomal protein L9